MPTQETLALEISAKEIVKSHLGVEVDHVGSNPHKTDLLVSAELGVYSIDVTRASDEWRMLQDGTLRGIGANLPILIEGMATSLFVGLGRASNAFSIKSRAIELSELAAACEFDFIGDYEYYKARAEPQFWGISVADQELLRLCKSLDIASLQKMDGESRLICVPSLYGGSWSGSSFEFDQWLSDFVTSDWFKTKVSKSRETAGTDLEIFVWLDPRTNYGAIEWLERGNGNPARIDFQPLELNGLWVASLYAGHSYCYFKNGSWFSRHNGQSEVPTYFGVDLR